MCHHSRCDPAVRFCILVSADERSGIKGAHAADSLGTMQSMPCGDLHRLVWRLIGSNVVHTASASCLGTLENVPDEIAPGTADGLSWICPNSHFALGTRAGMNSSQLVVVTWFREALHLTTCSAVAAGCAVNTAVTVTALCCLLKLLHEHAHTPF